MSRRTDAVIAALDRLHEEDPAGRELDYARAMTRRLDELVPDADPLLAIAVRAQHLKRWERPRSAFPEGRGGYLQWRRQAARHHAGLVSELLHEHEFEPAEIDRVIALVEKRGLGRDPQVQSLEDCACLVFIETELSDFRRKHPPHKVDEVLRKTWDKMSPRARTLAQPLLDKHAPR